MAKWLTLLIGTIVGAVMVIVLLYAAFPALYPATTSMNRQFATWGAWVHEQATGTEITIK